MSALPAVRLWDDGDMPDRSRKRPRDLNSLAASIVRDATNETPPESADDGKGPGCCCVGPQRRIKGRRQS